MATLVIPILEDSSKESVGSHVLRVILFGTVPTSILVVPAEVPIAPADPLVALEVGAVSVISPTGVLDLVDCSSSSDSDPSKDSLPLAPELPLVSPFLCFNNSEVDRESEPAEQRPKRHESLTPSSKFPFAPVVAPPRIRRRPSILVRLDFTSDSSSSGSSLDSSSEISSGSFSDSLSDLSSVHSLGCDASGQSHSGPSTRVASPRLVYPPIGLYDIRSLDSSSPSAGPSRKRCTSPNTLLPLSTLASGEDHMEIGTADAETVADLVISEGVGDPTEDDICMVVEVVTSDIKEDRVEKFIGGLLDNIQGNVIAAEPTRLQDVVRIAKNLIDQKLKGYAMKKAENKRKFNNSQKDNRGQ
uniref:Uncharacterized protein n=1 Tax=Tanacetum cinerariifolium TaxID=118510 RepID=A0A6L2LJQ3_TANCI|nr:hypothetical protein [Tanacetum cinerariifolium]